MKNKAQKRLSFEPIFHRKLSQSKYTPISIKAAKGGNSISSKEIAEERDEIIAQGFIVCEGRAELSVAKIDNADKGDVATVIANTNPLFRLHNRRNGVGNK
jgi:hypothetical protein